MKFKIMIFLFCTLFFNAQAVFCEDLSSTTTTTSPSENESSTTTFPPENESSTTTFPPENESSTTTFPPENPFSTETLPTDKVEKRYAGQGFTARFDQKATLKAMEITDTAFGKVFIKRPGMMRWEYEAPEKQIIITDSNTLWMYRPDDNQVMTGNAPTYFGDGKGASFLSDIKVIRKNFVVTLEKKNNLGYHILKLVPKEKKYDIAAIYLSISKTTSDVAQIVTYNSYGDETLIEMSEFQFNQNLDDAMFSFTIPEGTDILQLEE